MNFRKPRPEEPEINLIPFIDVLLVILIFLMLSTTYSKFTELQITLPAADADKARDRPREVIVSVSAVVSADAAAAHQSVINVMDAARRAGLPRLTFAAQTPHGGGDSR
jgi:biopolymer transport protein ExbD